ncbi:MAG: hemerythrin domain-containing protein [Pyrinomonadaceae bacterium]|nr:hemerythrin domain-containing protein [Pyrinomonadaceae bacterium]
MNPFDADNADFSKPLDFLFHCHQRIAANLEGLRRAAGDLKVAEPSDIPTVIETVSGVLTYLSSAGAKHTLDEEVSLFPRIRNHNDDGTEEIFEVLDQLESQHKRAASIEGRLATMAESLALIERPDTNSIDLFNDLAESLYDLYKPHIQIENEFVFPASAQILTAGEQLEAGKEMYARRRTKIKPLEKGRS